MLERVREIPRGFVRTYGDVSPGAPRFAGTVLFEVDEPDLPWWRVVRADGSLAKGARQKRHLVAEGVPFRGERVEMSVARVTRVSPRPGRYAGRADRGALGQMTIRWKSASALAPFSSRVWTSIAFGVRRPMLVCA